MRQLVSHMAQQLRHVYSLMGGICGFVIIIQYTVNGEKRISTFTKLHASNIEDPFGWDEQFIA